VTTIVAMRAADLRAVVRGSESGVCSGCGAQVVLAPTSLELIGAEPDVRVLCVPCATAEIERTDEPVQLEPVPGQAEELARELARREQERAALELFDAGVPVAIEQPYLRALLLAHRWGRHADERPADCPACRREDGPPDLTGWQAFGLS
jgi:hypothetical protein